MSAFTPVPPSSRDAQRLLALVDALLQSGSRLEEQYWDVQLDQQLEKILGARKNRHIEAALDGLSGQQPDAYDLLMEKAEALTESLQLVEGDNAFDALLIAAPVNVWTRYQLPDGRLDAGQRQALHQALHDTILAPQARLAITDRLHNYESLPQSFHATRALTRQLAQSALAGRAVARVAASARTDESNMLADVLYLIGVAIVPRGQAVFQWQDKAAQTAERRVDCARAWEARCASVLDGVFTGCHAHYLRPDAYYGNNREAEQHIRPLVLRAAVSWLQTAAGVTPGELRAAIVGCGEPMLQEYRIGFSTRDDKTVIYGCQWPILSREEALNEFMEGDGPGAVAEITALLKEEGIGEIRRLPDCSEAEFCEDCGAPFFPDMLGELQHPELPEEANLDPTLFH